jgi:6-phosphogluconolactonase
MSNFSPSRIQSARKMVKTFKGVSELIQYAARSFIEIANKSIEERGRFLTALSGGSTPMRLYELLGDQFQNEIDWSYVHFFWGDERCVPVDDTGNNYGQTKKVWFDKINVPNENVHRVLAELEPDSAAKKYARTLNDFAESPLAWPRFDLTLLGMGDDGHTASLFPNSPVEIDSPTLAVTANYQGRPANRVTLTPKVLNSSRNIMFLVIGNSKAASLSRVLGGNDMPKELPAQRIAPKDGKLIWLIDEEAGSLLDYSS